MLFCSFIKPIKDCDSSNTVATETYAPLIVCPMDSDLNEAHSPIGVIEFAALCE